MLALGVERVRRHHLPGQVQALQQWPELGDLVGLAVHLGLGQDPAGGVVHRRQQVHLRAGVVAAAAQGLAVDRDRPPRRAARRSRPLRWVLVDQPGADGAVQRVGVDAGQHAAHGRLPGRPEGAGQRVTARPERGQDRPRRIRRPLADRGQRLGAGQHRSHRHGQHHAQRMPSAASPARVGDLGEVVEQATALVGCQHGGWVQPLGSHRDGG